MPNQASQLVEQRVVAFSLGHPGLGPRRIAPRSPSIVFQTNLTTIAVWSAIGPPALAAATT
jgi:hypothetical protein